MKPSTDESSFGQRVRELADAIHAGPREIGAGKMADRLLDLADQIDRDAMRLRTKYGRLARHLEALDRIERPWLLLTGDLRDLSGDPDARLPPGDVAVTCGCHGLIAAGRPESMTTARHERMVREGAEKEPEDRDDQPKAHRWVPNPGSQSRCTDCLVMQHRFRNPPEVRYSVNGATYLDEAPYFRKDEPPCTNLDGIREWLRLPPGVATEPRQGGEQG